MARFPLHPGARRPPEGSISLDDPPAVPHKETASSATPGPAVRGFGDEATPLIRMALMAAVPLWIEEVRKWPEVRRLDRAQVCGQYIAEKGDLILFRSKKKGESAAAFNRLAEGLACLAFAPGGVRIFGLHFEA